MKKPSTITKPVSTKRKRKPLSRKEMIRVLADHVANAVATTDLGSDVEENVIKQLSDVLTETHTAARARYRRAAAAADAEPGDEPPLGTCTFNDSSATTTHAECDDLHGSWS